jgi:sterol desaturase/sphingolipid hydroxylase (fatty acid hydroxylase superfamily)
MAHPAINHSPVPIRLFKSNFMEFFTHISPLVVLIFYLPIIIYLYARAVAGGFSLWQVLLSLVIGLFLWTFTEYTMHRFVFHYRPRTPRQEKIVFLFHGIHHAQPQVKTRLVMPLVVSLPMGALLYLIVSGVVGSLLGLPGWVQPLFAAMMLGYLIYDLTHYATHHLSMRKGVLKALKRYHMMHHYRSPDARYGVTSPLWDRVFATRGT